MRQAGLFSKQLWFCLAIICLAPIGRAQDYSWVSGLKQSPADVLKAFEPAPDQEYQLGRGDEISVDVISRPELSGKHVVGPDGRITIPVAGDVEVEGKTRSQAAAAIQTALGTYYQNLTASVSVDRYTSNHLLLLGAVEHPGLLAFDGPPTLLEVIARGGVGAQPNQRSSDSSSSSMSLSPPASVPELCLIYRGQQTMVAVRLRDLVKSGDPSANMRLRRDDIVFVPGESPYVSILGSVLRPGLQRLDSTSTLSQLLAQSGGPSDKAGRYPKIFIVHPASESGAGAIQTISFEDVVKARPMHPIFHSGDIIYVPESGFNRTADVVQKISPLISLITVGALLD